MESPTRRVLGNKDTNTHLQARRNQAHTGGGDMKAAMDGGNSMRVPATPSSKTPTSTGQKRKIDEVEDAERVERDRPSDSQKTTLLEDSDFETDTQDVSMSTFQRSYETAGTSFLGSQNIVEPQFELQQDEMSQRTLDKLNAVPLPQNTSQLPPWQPSLLHDNSAGSIGLSAYFNLDDQASTQGSDGLQMIENVVKAHAPDPSKSTNDALKPTKEDMEKSKDQDVTSAPRTSAAPQITTLPSIIEAAKTRLQLAMYKVQTKQVHKPFSRLKHDSLQSPRTQGDRRFIPPPEDIHTSKSLSSDATITLEAFNRDLRKAHNNNESNTADTREREDGSDANQQRRDRSESVIADSCKNSQSTNIGTQNFLSSPPLSRQHSTDSLEELLPPNNMTNSSQNNSQEHRKQSPQSSQSHQQQQLSSPPISDSGRDRNTTVQAQPIGQGEAATGLLQLMTGGSGLCGV